MFLLLFGMSKEKDMMEMKTKSQKLKIQLMGAILSASVSAFALTSATYSWYVANNKVTSETSSIMAEANGFMLQIVKLGDTLDHGSDTALVSAVEGHKISPASTEDAKSWWVPENWNADMNVATYMHPTWDIDEKGNTLYGQYTVGDETYYAYAVGEYTLYTLTNTGICDVYLDGSNPEGAVQVTIKDADGKETAVNDKVAASLRVGITIDAGKGSGEKLVLVYAPKAEDINAHGNDVNSTNGWSVVKDSNSTKKPSYPYVYEKNYTWTDSADGKTYNYAATKDGFSYILPTGNARKIASGVDYDGNTTMRVYIWMEGTDADCISRIVDGDERQFNVTVHLAGVSAE